jgi:hypothetical protein
MHRDEFESKFAKHGDWERPERAATAPLSLDLVQNWLLYWGGKAVALGEIRTRADVALARRFCRCLRTGALSDVTDQQIWNALQRLLKELAKKRAGQPGE